MTSAAPPRQPVTDGLVAMLASVTTFPCWDADGPLPPDADFATMPYSVVELIGGGVAYGDVGAPDGMADVSWQVTAVGETRAQALGLADLCRTAITSRASGGAFTNTITAAGVSVIDRRWDSDGGTQVEGPVVNVTETFRLTLVAT